MCVSFLFYDSKFIYNIRKKKMHILYYYIYISMFRGGLFPKTIPIEKIKRETNKIYKHKTEIGYKRLC